MISKATRLGRLVLIAAALTITWTAAAQPPVGQRVDSPPFVGNYFSMQQTNWPPLPSLPFDVPVYSLGALPDGSVGYAYDDRDIDYSALELESASSQMLD